jgi:hypothetical protein
MRSNCAKTTALSSISADGACLVFPGTTTQPPTNYIPFVEWPLIVPRAMPRPGNQRKYAGCCRNKPNNATLCAVTNTATWLKTG